MSGVKSELVWLNIINSFLLAFRWALVTAAVVGTAGAIINTWRFIP